MGEKINILDVSARDGLQNEPRLVSTNDKLTLIEKLVRAGVRDIQATSFVHPRWVPQMADAEPLAAHFGEFTGVRFSALVPNVKGYERAVASGVRYLEFVLSASDTFNRKNLNRTLTESLTLLEEVSRAAERDGVTIRTGISTRFHCPFEGTISAEALLAVVKASGRAGSWRGRTGVARSCSLASCGLRYGRYGLSRSGA
jgi:hydroxymethylglutaryl-CoA lyase